MCATRIVVIGRVVEFLPLPRPISRARKDRVVRLPILDHLLPKEQVFDAIKTAVERTERATRLVQVTVRLSTTGECQATVLNVKPFS